MKLETGVIIGIPLLHDLGYVYAKYIDLMGISRDSTFPDAIKVYRTHTATISEASNLELKEYLLSPMLVAGLGPTLKRGLWKTVGKAPVLAVDLELPEFKGGNSSIDEIEKGDWFLYKKCQLNNKMKSSYEEVKFLQPFSAVATGNIEIRLTMYYLLFQKKQVQSFFDLNDDRFAWNYRQVLDSPILSDLTVP